MPANQNNDWYETDKSGVYTKKAELWKEPSTCFDYFLFDDDSAKLSTNSGQNIVNHFVDYVEEFFINTETLHFWRLIC